MDKLTIRFKVAPNANPQEAADLVRHELAALPEVAEIDARVESARFVGPEIIAAILVAGSVAGAVNNLVTLVKNLKPIEERLRAHGVSDIYVVQGLRTIPLSEYHPDDRR